MWLVLERSRKVMSGQETAQAAMAFQMEHGAKLLGDKDSLRRMCSHSFRLLYSASIVGVPDASDEADDTIVWLASYCSVSRYANPL